jgi:hypothetical protein
MVDVPVCVATGVAVREALEIASQEADPKTNTKHPGAHPLRRTRAWRTIPVGVFQVSP